MAERGEAIRAAARRHGLGEAAVAVLWDALVRGGGRQAQFSHPELGGMGQWSGGMGQIGDMFNAELKARVAGACADLSAAIVESGSSSPASRPRASVPAAGTRPLGSREPVPGSGEPAAWEPMDFGPDWWPTDLGRPSATGAQNGVRYAVFPDRARLAVERDGRTTLYDTGHHRIGGVSQARSTGAHLAFTSQDGAVDLESLAVVAR